MSRIWWICFFMIVANQVHAEGKQITMSCFEETASSPMAQYLEMVYKEAFHRLGYQFAFKIVPARRASIEANSGITDGEPARRYNLNKEFTNLVRIEEPVAIVSIGAFATNPKIQVSSWEAVKNLNYKVDYLRGMTILEKANLKPENTYQLNSRDQALTRLVKGRADLYVDSELDFQAVLNRIDPAHKSGIRLIGILEKIETFGYLHVRYASLAPRVAQVLRQMKSDGILDRYLSVVHGN